MAEKISYRYVGPGFCPGIPARDLTAEEVKAIGEDVVKGIISPNTKEPMYKKASSKKKAEKLPEEGQAILKDELVVEEVK